MSTTSYSLIEVHRILLKGDRSSLVYAGKLFVRSKLRIDLYRHQPTETNQYKTALRPSHPVQDSETTEDSSYQQQSPGFPDRGVRRVIPPEH